MKLKDLLVGVMLVIGGIVLVRILVRFIAWNVMPLVIPALVVGGLVWLLFFNKD